MLAYLCVCMCVCTRVRACVRACVRAMYVGLWVVGVMVRVAVWVCGCVGASGPGLLSFPRSLIQIPKYIKDNTILVKLSDT